MNLTPKFLASSILLLITACGSPQRQTIETQGTSNTGTTPNTPVFNTSTTSPTGTATSNLFSTQSNGSASTATSTTTTNPVTTLPAAGASTIAPVTASETACLTGGFGLSNFGTGSQPSTGSCLNAGSYGFDPRLLYQGAQTSYRTADYCLNQAAQFAPSPGQSQADVEILIRFAEAGLVRCIRDLNRFQSQILPWGNQQTAAFQFNDSNMYNIGQAIAR